MTTTTTTYILASVAPSGETYALRTDETGTILGVSGPLYYADYRDADGRIRTDDLDEYNYDLDAEQVAWANAQEWTPRTGGTFPGEYR